LSGEHPRGRAADAEASSDDEGGLALQSELRSGFVHVEHRSVC
jgi:hypothetical protein